MILTADDRRDDVISPVRVPKQTACGIGHEFCTGIYAALRPNTSRRWRWWKVIYNFCRVKKYVFFLHSRRSGRSGSRNHNFEKLDGILQSMGLTSTPPLCESNRPDRSEIILPDAEDVHLLGIDTVEYKRSIKTGVKGTPKTINTYDVSADSEQSSL